MRWRPTEWEASAAMGLPPPSVSRLAWQRELAAKPAWPAEVVESMSFAVAEAEAPAA
jgi:hypothetical protein